MHIFNPLYKSTDPALYDYARQSMAELHLVYRLPVFDFNNRSTIPSRRELLAACEKLAEIFQSMRNADNSDSVTRAIGSMVSSYANRVTYSLTYYYRLTPPLTVSCRPLEHRINWFLEQKNNAAFLN